MLSLKPITKGQWSSGPRELPTTSETHVLTVVAHEAVVALAQAETSGRKTASNTLSAYYKLLAVRVCPWFIVV